MEDAHDGVSCPVIPVIPRPRDGYAFEIVRNLSE